MYVKDVNKVDRKKYLNSIPFFKKRNITYLRKEKDDYYTFYSSVGFLEEMVMNVTSLEMLKMFTGKDTVANIEKKLCKKYWDTDSELIKKDLKNVLFDLSRIEIVGWVKGGNPFMEVYKKNLKGNCTLSLANESEIAAILDYVKNITKQGSYIYYINPTRNISEYTDIVVMRYKLFSFNEEIFTIKDCDENIIGIVTIELPDRPNSTVSSIGLVNIPKIIARETMSFVLESLRAIAVKDVTKIRATIPVDNDNKCSDYFVEMGFEVEANLKREFGNKDAVVFSCAY